MSARAETTTPTPPRHLVHHPYSMSRKNESVAWRAFVKLGNNKVVCRICNKHMNYQSGSSTSNMMKHLQAVHKHILAEAKPGILHNNNSNTTTNTTTTTTTTTTPPTPVKGAADDLTTNTIGSEPWAALQNAPAHLRQRWQDLKLGLQKEMQQHQQEVAWSVIGAPCLGAPAGADLATDSDISCWRGPSTNNTTSNHNLSSTTASTREANSVDTGVEWQNRDREQSRESSSYPYHVKAEPVENDDVVEQQSEQLNLSSPLPLALSVPPRSPSPIVLPATESDGSGDHTPSEQNDGPPPPKNKKHCASQTTIQLPTSLSIESAAELDLRLNGLRRAQERAEELHHEHLRESRARADAAQAERDHRLQLIRHAEEIHQQTLEAQRQALEHSRQLHELTLRQSQGKPCE